MTPATLLELRSPQGAEALAQAAALNPTDATLLGCLTHLRRRFSVDLANAALETVLLRQRAAAKFSRANAMFFTRPALEQASSETVARYRSKRYRPMTTVADLCCGLGGDALALAVEHQVLAVDADPLRLAIAAANFEAYGCREQVQLLHGDVLTVNLPAVDAAFFDPDRRSDGRRHISLKHYEPPLERMRARLHPEMPLGVKVAPAVAWHEIADFGAEVEFISLAGELKECVLWFNSLRTTCRRATLLPDFGTLSSDLPLSAEQSLPQSEPRQFLYDPDPAVVRAGLLPELAEILEASLIDPQIAFLTAARLQPSPFATAYRIDEVHPFHLKRLAERLRALNVGTMTVVKRGSAVDPETVLRHCKLSGIEHRVVILTRTANRPAMLIGARVST